MRLPNSHLIAQYSTVRYRFADTVENLIKPDKQIEREWISYQSGRDPVLEWVLGYRTR